MTLWNKESMNCWDNIEPTDENVSRLFYFHHLNGIFPLIKYYV